MHVAISGTPGTGKTTLSILLREKGYSIIDLNKLAVDKGFITGIDKKRNSKIMDLNGLNRYIEDYYRSKDIIFIEGHASHLLNNIDYTIILRCHPKPLKNRLKKKGWSSEKIKENVEAEILDIILCEAVDIYSEDKIFEIDTSKSSSQSILFSIIEIINHDFKPIKKFKIGQIDWSEEILNDV